MKKPSRLHFSSFARKERRFSLAMEDRVLSQLKDLKTKENSLLQLNATLEEQNQRKTCITMKTKSLREKVNEEGANAKVQKLLALLESLKAPENEKVDVRSHCRSTYSLIQAEINEVDEVVGNGNNSKRLSKFIEDSLLDSFERLQSAKRELATKRREIVRLKRLADDVPTQAELNQYESRFSELNFHIQGKLQQTRKHYATYNALMEIKDLMLNETSLLNSISSQFQDSITTTAGRTTLISSMEGISKSIQQKLQKVQHAQEAEQKACEALKEKHAIANSEQRRGYALLKAFQEECARNERLQN